MNRLISLSYDGNTPDDASCIACFEHSVSKDDNIKPGNITALVMYLEQNADTLLRLVTEQGYLDEFRCEIRRKALEDAFIAIDAAKSNSKEQAVKWGLTYASDIVTAMVLKQHMDGMVLKEHTGARLNDNKSYNQALEDYEMKIKECCSVAGSCDFEDMVKIKEQLKK